MPDELADGDKEVRFLSGLRKAIGEVQGRSKGRDYVFNVFAALVTILAINIPRILESTDPEKPNIFEVMFDYVDGYEVYFNFALGWIAAYSLFNFLEYSFANPLVRKELKNDILFENALNRRDKIRRNANILAVVCILASYYPAIVTELQYLKGIKGVEYRWVVFSTLLLFSMYNFIVLANANYDVSRHGGFNELPAVRKRTWAEVIFFKNLDFQPLIIRLIPNGLMFTGFAACLTRLIFEASK